MVKRKIQDFGEKIGGARKDVWRHRGLNVTDIEEFNISELLEHVNKKNVWIEPKWAQLLDEGYSQNALYMIKTIRDKLPSRIKSDDIAQEIRRNGEAYMTNILMQKCTAYITMISRVKEAALYIKTDEQCFDVYNILKQCDDELREEFNHRVSVPLDKFRRLTESEIKRIGFEAQVQNFPYSFKRDLQGVAIRKFRQYRDGVVRYSVEIPNKFRKEFETADEAKQFCLSGQLLQALEAKAKVKKESKVVKVVRPQLEHIERLGPDIRHNANVTGDDILKVFGLRAGEFGNWNSDDDRQACLNYIFDAFLDLMYCMDTENNFIALNKELINKQ